MCGIAGFTGEAPDGTLQRMCQSLAHRGPDAEGFLSVDDVHLGHRRLSILDLEGGAQPMTTVDRDLSVVFNGEIYNHAELRIRLEGLGHSFRTDHSDTEVLLHGYRQWGRALCEEMNGMWAFVIYDRVKRRLFAARDRFGKKPLYYAITSSGFLFASELKALLCHPAIPRELDPQALGKMFAYNFIPAPYALVKGTHKLPGGHFLEYRPATRQIEVRRYWELDTTTSVPSSDLEETKTELLQKLESAVQRRLIADVPLGVFLSGGIDSSLVAALAARHTNKLHTFAIGFTEESFDESRYARTVARHIGSEHHEEILDLDKARDLLPALFEHLDEPNGDASLLPTSLLAAFTRRSVTVALGGDGGDELFAGYDPFQALQPARLYSRTVPARLHRLIRSAVNLMSVSHKNISLDFKLKRTLRGLSYPSSLWLPVWMGPLDPEDLEELLPGMFARDAVYSDATELAQRFASDGLTTQALHFFTRLYMQDAVLAKVDRATMRHGLEARAPFLDRDFAAFAAALPSHYKLRGSTTKWILKEAALTLLPEQIVHRRKKGFGMPISRWTKDALFEPVDAPGLCTNLSFAKRLWHEHRLGKANHAMFLWTHHLFTCWLRSLVA